MTRYLFLLFLLSCLTTNELKAQLGIGVHIGEPTALSVQYQPRGGMAADFLFAYDLNDYLFINGHGLWKRTLDDGGHFSFYYGPGAFVLLRGPRRDRWNDDAQLGLSGNFGLSFRFSRIDLFAQITPRFSVVPATEFGVGGGFGGRFWF